MDAAEDLLAKYKKHPFAKGLLPFQSSVAALGTPESKVFARQEGRQRWVICDKATGLPALFSHAAVFAEADPMETGNFVPPDETIPSGIDPRNVQRRANIRCFYTYILDTFQDISLYEGQWSLDDYISGVPGFNPRTLPRRAYLSGQDVRYRGRFWMQTPMFLRKGAQTDPSGATAHLHPWVIDADRQSKGFRGNPDRPRVWVKDGDDVVPISEREPGTLQRGDILGVSFTVTYHITNSNWFPQFHPADIAVLKAGDGEITDYSAPAIDLYSRPPPSFGGVADHDSREAEEEASGSRGAMEGARGATSGVSAMEDVVEEATGLTLEGGGSEHRQERMDVDEAGAPVGGGSSDTLGSSSGMPKGGNEGFELLGSEGDGGENEDDEFVDVVPQLEDAPTLRSGSGRSGRSGRRRL